MLWVDKHRPTALEKLSYHAELGERLGSMAEDGDIPHLLFYGPSGAGKKTRVQCLLKALYGAGAEKQRLEHREFKTPTNKTIEVTTVASNYHIEMNPSDAGNNDRFVVQEVIKEIAQSGSVLAKTGAQKKGPAFKVILMVEVDRLSRQAQAGLRRTMEKSSSACRLVMICTNPSKVIDPIRSRCLGIRIAAPCVSVSLVFSTRYVVDAATARGGLRRRRDTARAGPRRRSWASYMRSARRSASRYRTSSPRASPSPRAAI